MKKGGKVFWIDYRLSQELVTIAVVEKLRAQTSITATGCWQWDGWRNTSGYGETSYRNKYHRIHRLSYELLVGPIPEGMDICHKCDHAPCWNPEHLEPGTQKKNSQEIVERGRNVNANRTHCPRGHSFAEHGVRHGKFQWRNCRICLRARERLRMGWPIELAYSMDAVPLGHRPIGGRKALNKGKRAIKTHCNQGHLKDGDNLYITPEGRRHCKMCRLANVIKSGLKYRLAAHNGRAEHE